MISQHVIIAIMGDVICIIYTYIHTMKNHCVFINTFFIRFGCGGAEWWWKMAHWLLLYSCKYNLFSKRKWTEIHVKYIVNVEALNRILW